MILALTDGKGRLVIDVICPCGNRIDDHHGNRKYCLTCSPKRIYKPRERVRVPKPRIPLVPRDCVLCGDSFTPGQNHFAKYCSNACRQRSKYLPGGAYYKKGFPCAQCGELTPRWAKSVPGKSRCPKCIHAGKADGKSKDGRSIRAFECAGCGKSAECRADNVNTRYCSRDCYFRSQYGQDWVSGVGTGSCEQCGEEFSKKYEAQKFCSLRCSGMANKDFLPIRKAAFKQCKWCLTMYASPGDSCSVKCRDEYRKHKKKAQRSPLRAAFEDERHDDVISIIEGFCEIRDGHWIWLRKLDNKGYAKINIAGQNLAVHRLILEAKHGKKLGSQHAHHICAVPQCVNPDHLQPVTHRENIAEMLQRHSYLNRIADLEAALSAIDPSHPILDVIEIA